MSLASAFGFALGIGRERNWSLLGLQTRLEMNKAEHVAGLAALTISGTRRAVGKRGPLQTASTVPPFHLKLGAWGSKVVAHTLCAPHLVPEGHLRLQTQPPP